MPGPILGDWVAAVFVGVGVLLFVLLGRALGALLCALVWVGKAGSSPGGGSCDTQHRASAHLEAAAVWLSLGAGLLLEWVFWGSYGCVVCL
jgi:hypothetical protein